MAVPRALTTASLAVAAAQRRQAAGVCPPGVWRVAAEVRCTPAAAKRSGCKLRTGGSHLSCEQPRRDDYSMILLVPPLCQPTFRVHHWRSGRTGEATRPDPGAGWRPDGRDVRTGGPAPLATGMYARESTRGGSASRQLQGLESNSRHGSSNCPRVHGQGYGLLNGKGQVGPGCSR